MRLETLALRPFAALRLVDGATPEVAGSPREFIEASVAYDVRVWETGDARERPPRGLRLVARPGRIALDFGQGAVFSGASYAPDAPLDVPKGFLNLSGSLVDGSGRWFPRRFELTLDETALPARRAGVAELAELEVFPSPSLRAPGIPIVRTHLAYHGGAPASWALVEVRVTTDTASITLRTQADLAGDVHLALACVPLPAVDAAGWVCTLRARAVPAEQLATDERKGRPETWRGIDHELAVPVGLAGGAVGDSVTFRLVHANGRIRAVGLAAELALAP